ncbi:tRNA pseudouridine(55) synthase TruB [Robiginitalea sp. M366]|uniref:tRNA pseudouridine(55) synthase TruB n=1 Tax=Robiginitalea aestuariiviva TaxID=3036903 RepID=UPI00240D7ED7|nr:tRNA pseudouridine(55) synthase TruB [Robiginitalea aestuariiviva]MDG1571750.1 tRNA pseudouridine(55) synthase TruB [Robiginitalea aestuariiviva]
MELSRDAFLEGQVLLVDKPYGWSSFQALNAVKWTLRRAFDLKKIKVGHAGTLDPLATGLLLICTGKATKTIADLQGMPKTYEGALVLGHTTPSFDLETEPEPSGSWEGLTPADLEAAAARFTGTIRQRPPVFSAIKKDGKRLYEYARKGKEVEVPERTVTITRLEITGIDWPEVRFTADCSKGTYIRSLAHDLGQELGCGAYLSALKRTKIGSYSVDNAVTPDAFKARFREAGFSL